MGNAIAACGSEEPFFGSEDQGSETGEDKVNDDIFEEEDASNFVTDHDDKRDGANDNVRAARNFSSLLGPRPGSAPQVDADSNLVPPSSFSTPSSPVPLSSRPRMRSRSLGSARVQSGRPATEKISRGGSSGCPLPHSAIWTFQREFYASQGIESWQRGVVPSFASTNVRLAHGYARSIFEFVRARNRARSHPLTRAYVLEFGAGAGKFGFHVASRLLQLEQESLRGGDKPTRIVYVLTEVHEVSVRFWKSHSALQTLFDEGVLDLAVVDAAHVDGCDPIVLEMSGSTITAGQTEAPVIGVCNYLFDSLEQDAFQVRRGVLYRAQVEIVGGLGKPLPVRRSLDTSTMRSPAPGSPGRSPPHGGDNDGGTCQWSGGSLQFRPQLSWTYDLCDAAEDALLARELLPRGSAVEREVLVQQLRRYQAEEDELSVLIPLGAIRVVRNLVRLCYDPADVMILVADKGFHEVEEFAKIEDPQMVMHGGVSFMMNFHFFSRFCERVYRGAHVRRTSYMDGFKAMAVMFKYDHSLRRCDAALDQLLHGSDPGQIATLHAWSTTRERVKSLDEGLALLRTSDYDQGSFLEVKHVFDSVLCGPELEYDLSIDLATLMSAYYPLQTFKDVAFETGRVYMNLGDYASASALFQRSLVDCGGHPVTWLNLGVCLAHCAKPEEARAAFEASLALDPDMKRTRICLNQLQVGAKVEQEQAVNM